MKHIEVRRNLQMNILAARLVFKVPITWMTGYYRLENAKLFHFIPAGGDGNFNIDLKYMTIEVIFTLKSTNTPLILSRMNSKMNNPEKALNSVSQIDKISRIVFPMAFILLNGFYWFSYLKHSQRIDLNFESA